MVGCGAVWKRKEIAKIQRVADELWKDLERRDAEIKIIRQHCVHNSIFYVPTSSTAKIRQEGEHSCLNLSPQPPLVSQESRLRTFLPAWYFSASFNSFLCLSSWHNETWCCTFGMWLQTLPPLWVSLAKSNSWVVPSSVSCVLPMCQREQGTWKDPEVSQRPVRYSQHINIVGLWTRNCPAQAGKGSEK